MRFNFTNANVVVVIFKFLIDRYNVFQRQKFSNLENHSTNIILAANETLNHTIESMDAKIGFHDIKVDSLVGNMSNLGGRIDIIQKSLDSNEKIPNPPTHSPNLMILEGIMSKCVRNMRTKLRRWKGKYPLNKKIKTWINDNKS